MSEWPESSGDRQANVKKSVDTIGAVRSIGEEGTPTELDEITDKFTKKNILLMQMLYFDAHTVSEEIKHNYMEHICTMCCIF